MKDIDKELEELAMDIVPQEDFNKIIEKQINKRIRKIALKVVFIVILIVILVFLGISPIMNLCNTNAMELNQGSQSQLLSSLRTYFETTHPYIEVVSVDTKKDGFGQYTLNLNVVDHKERIEIVVNNVELKMKRGELTVESDPERLLTNRLGAFYEADNSEDSNTKYVMKEIGKLPDSTYLYVSVSENTAKNASTIISRMNDNLLLQWLQVYQENVDFQGGISVNLCGNFDKDDYRTEMSAEALKQVYISNLQELYDNQNIWNGFELYSGNSVFYEKSQVLQDAIKEAKKTKTLKTKNYCISGEKKEVLNYLKNTDLKSVWVDEVKLSILAN